MFTNPSILKVFKDNLKPGLLEFKNSIYKRGYLSEVQKYCPSLTLGDLKPYPAGVRAQAISKDGKLMDDFLFMNTKRTVNVCNAPSPAATSAIPIGRHILKGDQINRISTGHQNGWGLQNFIGNAQELVLEGDNLLAVGGSYENPHAECGLEFNRAHSEAADNTTGFRLLREEVQPPALQTVSQ